MDINKIIDSSWYYFLFGSGGILAVIFTIIGLVKREKRKKEEPEKKKIEQSINNQPQNSNTSDINININFDEKPTKETNNKIVISKLESYQSKDYSKISKTDDADNIERKEKVISEYHAEYQKYSFSSDEFYVNFLTQIVEKKKGNDKINYE